MRNLTCRGEQEEGGCGVCVCVCVSCVCSSDTHRDGGGRMTALCSLKVDFCGPAFDTTSRGQVAMSRVPCHPAARWHI